MIALLDRYVETILTSRETYHASHRAGDIETCRECIVLLTTALAIVRAKTKSD